MFDGDMEGACVSVKAFRYRCSLGRFSLYLRKLINTLKKGRLPPGAYLGKYDF